MRRPGRTLVASTLALAVSAPALTQVATLPYNAGQAIPLALTPGYASLVELSPDERIETVVLGDSAGWQVTPTKRGDALVIKPAANAATTDLVVSTGERQYIFLLKMSAMGQAPGPYVVRFDYSDERAPATAASIPAGHYDFRGRTNLYPTAMGDDGVRTTITWGPRTPLPAVFALDDLGHEALVNGRMVGNDFVVERIASGFVFRRGKSVATATRRPVPPSR